MPRIKILVKTIIVTHVKQWKLIQIVHHVVTKIVITADKNYYTQGKDYFLTFLHGDDFDILLLLFYFEDVHIFQLSLSFRVLGVLE